MSTIFKTDYIFFNFVVFVWKVGSDTMVVVRSKIKAQKNVSLLTFPVSRLWKTRKLENENTAHI